MRKVLLTTSDDLGMCHAVNEGIVLAEIFKPDETVTHGI